MKDDRLPKTVLCGELDAGHRNVGRPHLRFSDCTTSHLNCSGIDVHQWEDLARDRRLWQWQKRPGQRTQNQDKTWTCKRRFVSRLCTTNCSFCGRGLSSRIGHVSPKRACGRPLPADQLIPNVLCRVIIINPPMVWPFKIFQNLLPGKMAINISEPFKTLHNFLLLHYHTFQYPLKGFEW